MPLSRCAIILLLLLFVNISWAQTCDDQVNCNGHGECQILSNNTFTCDCEEGWTSDPSEGEIVDGNLVFCNYEQKQQLVAFLLSFFLGAYGGGRWYCGLYTTAAIKLALFYCLFCCGGFLVNMMCGKAQGIVYLSVSICICW